MLFYAYFIVQRWKDLLHDSVCLAATQEWRLLFASFCVFMFCKLIVLQELFEYIHVHLYYLGIPAKREEVAKCILFSNDRIF